MEDKIKKGVEDFNNRFADVMKELAEEEYKSHYCCWEQDTPACGMSVDEHPWCCICKKRMPEEQEWEARKRLKAPPFDKEESKSTEQILCKCKKFHHNRCPLFMRNPDNSVSPLDIKIGMLRQWLYEDRITDVNKMVTNEDLKHWLMPRKSTEQILTEILAEIHTMPVSENRVADFETGYTEAKRDIARIIKSYILNEK